jgi:hypothetical protein
VIEHYWTPADSAELDVLVYELARGHAIHRERCAACKPEPCPALANYLEHRETCRNCEHGIKVRTATYGDPCPRYLQHVAHGDGCPRCNPCVHVRNAIEEIVEWRELRVLRSKAAWLRRLELEREREPSRVHAVFDERGDLIEYELRPEREAA